MKDIAERFWSKVNKSTGCWEWSAGRTQAPNGQPGYGCFCLGSRTDGTKRMHAAHRVAWVLSYGPIPEGVNVLHRCDNVRCVRPDHLFLGTQADNVDDMVTKGRKVTARGERHGSAKLSECQVASIRLEHRPGRGGNTRELARRFGVKPGTITDAATRSWRHVQ